MHQTRLLQQWVKLFTRPRCGLCANAKAEIEKAAQTARFSYAEVDITEPSSKEWYDKYAFDVPVVHVAEHEHGPPREMFMHRVDSAQLAAAVDALGNKHIN